MLRRFGTPCESPMKAPGFRGVDHGAARRQKRAQGSFMAVHVTDVGFEVILSVMALDGARCSS